jgi:hypothetical protein
MKRDMANLLLKSVKNGYWVVKRDIQKGLPARGYATHSAHSRVRAFLGRRNTWRGGVEKGQRRRPCVVWRGGEVSVIRNQRKGKVDRFGMIRVVCIIRTYKLDCDYCGKLNKNGGKKGVLHVKRKPTIFLDNNLGRPSCAVGGVRAYRVGRSFYGYCGHFAHPNPQFWGFRPGFAVRDRLFCLLNYFTMNFWGSQGFFSEKLLF